METMISNQIRIEDATPEIQVWVKENLRLPNPEYAKKERM